MTMLKRKGYSHAPQVLAFSYSIRQCTCLLAFTTVFLIKKIILASNSFAVIDLSVYGQI